jgi:hypothetical protein
VSELGVVLGKAFGFDRVGREFYFACIPLRRILGPFEGRVVLHRHIGTVKLAIELLMGYPSEILPPFGRVWSW